MKGLTKTSATQGVAIFQQVHETTQGGFKLDVSVLPADAYVEPGMPLGFDESTRVAKVVKQAVAQATATNTDVAYNVLKGHMFKVGDYLAMVVGGKAYAITAIDTTNAGYDILTVGTTLAVAVSVGDVFFQSSATGAAAAVYSVTAKGLNYMSTKVETGADVAVVNRGTVYTRRITGGVTAAVKALLPSIIFSDSY